MYVHIYMLSYAYVSLISSLLVSRIVMYDLDSFCYTCVSVVLALDVLEHVPVL